MTSFAADERIAVRCTVNGEAHRGFAEPRLQLADFLRHELGLFGTHVGCEHGVCGACTVLVDGRLTRACLMLALQAEGADIVTVEGLGTPDSLSDLQAAFHAHGALQCGFCTAGVLISATRFLETEPDPDEAAVRHMLSGHLCRCTGYAAIVAAILAVAAERGQP